MFTGIITDIGTLKSIEGGSGRCLVVGTAYDTSALATGASIACDGVCLTVIGTGADSFTAEASPTTLSVTTLRDWLPGRRINLEHALKAGDELGGHLVTGHIDGVAVIEKREEEAGSRRYTLSCPADLARFIAAKGSVTLDGVSLTVTWAEGDRFGITLIPHTLSVTNWTEKREGDGVNLEVDVLARYVLRSLKSEA